MSIIFQQSIMYIILLILESDLTSSRVISKVEL